MPPPPDACSKVSTPSTVDHASAIENIADCDNSKYDSISRESLSDEDTKSNQVKVDGVGLVKSLLGPSLEDAVLRTLEFGKSLIVPKDEPETVPKEKKMHKTLKKDVKEQNEPRNQLQIDWKGDDDKDLELKCDQIAERTTKKRIVFTAKLDKELLGFNKISSSKKPGSLSKIRSLDSDLKQTAPSPEKIKRQLEALIQINKDEPPEHASWSVYPNKTPKIPMNVTVMPTMCVYRNEASFNCSSTCDVQSGRRVSACNDSEPTSTSRLRGSHECTKRRSGNPAALRQAPEFISNALGPTIDVSIIDNLKMMRNLFKCDVNKDGKCSETYHPLPTSDQVNQTSCFLKSRSEDDMKRRIAEMEKRIEELQRKEQCLLDRMEQEERERECKRRAFEEEERKLQCCKLSMEGMGEAGRTKSDPDTKYENLKQRIICEEEKLSRLKDQYECYKREIIEAKNRREALKRNKSLLDAWDVIASRVCHTKLPSFSRAYNLERKQLGKGGDANLYCCFPGNEETRSGSPRRRRSRSRSRCSSRCRSLSQGFPCCSKSKESCKNTSQSEVQCSRARTCEDIPFPIQRDITCGLHQCLKTCNCSSDNVRNEPVTSNSDDELLKKGAGYRGENKHACRSRSDTTMKNKGSKIVKVLWAVTRINIFQDNCRTYEVMDATTNPPALTCGRTEGIFVVKNPRVCEPGPSKKRGHHRDRDRDRDRDRY